MITIILIAAAVLAVIFLLETVAASRAPLGYEDETGFHFTPKSQNPAIEQAERHGVGGWSLRAAAGNRPAPVQTN